MDLSIVIVNWKVKDFLRECLKSVYDQTQNIKFEIFVIDNNSEDGSVEMVQSEFPQVNLIEAKSNLGFAKGNNVGIEKCSGRYILLLNPDTEVLDHSLEKSVAYMDSHSDVDVMGVKLLYTDKTLQESCRRFPTLLSQVCVLLKLHNFFPNRGPIKRYYMKDFSYDEIREVDQIMGAYLLAKKEMFTRIGLLDERFFAWFEEVDWCRRAKNAGAKIIFYPQAEIIHHKGQSFNKYMKRQLLFNRGMLYYFRKHHNPLENIVLSLILPINLILDQLVSLLLFLRIPLKKKKNL